MQEEIPFFGQAHQSKYRNPEEREQSRKGRMQGKGKHPPEGQLSRRLRMADLPVHTPVEGVLFLDDTCLPYPSRIDRVGKTGNYRASLFFLWIVDVFYS